MRNRRNFKSGGENGSTTHVHQKRLAGGTRCIDLANLCSRRLAQQAPNSSGTEPAKLKAPAGACDCHQHIYDAARFPVRAGSRVIPNARIEDYRLLQKRIGTSRSIVVTPIGFPATLAENLVTLDAIKQAGGNAG